MYITYIIHAVCVYIYIYIYIYIHTHAQLKLIHLLFDKISNGNKTRKKTIIVLNT